MRSWWRHAALDGAIAVAWLASVGMIVRHEQGAMLVGMANPTASLGATLEAKEQWFSLSYQGQQIGWSQLQILPGERHGMPGVEIIDLGHLAFALLGTPQELDVGARAFIDADWRLQEFEASVRSPAYHLRWTGRRSGETLHLSVSTPMSTITKELRDPSGSAFVNGLSSWTAFHRLRVGQSGRAWALNPMALDPETIYFAVRRRETLDGRDVLVVETDMSGLTTTSWVTPDGDVLKELSPTGWELRRVSREEALRPPSPDAPAADLLSATAVPIDRPLDDPLRLERLTLLVEGLSEEMVGVRRPWQQLLPAGQLSDYHRPPPEGRWCLVQLARPAAPVVGTDGAAIPRDVERYRRPSPFVQSDDPRVSAKASEIAGTLSAPWDRVVALNRWVFSTLKKRLTVGLPSALDVLFMLEGDCHEHAVLMTAFARSLGIPARMVAGLVYQSDRFYYHAWVEVWIGGSWIPTDPTLGQPIADITHLGLLEADNESLTALGQFIGKLKIEVMEAT